MKKNVYNIVWADDEIDDLMSIYSDNLESNGFRIVGIAHDGEELERKLDELISSKMVDAVIVDANFNCSDDSVECERDTSGLDAAHSLFLHYQKSNQHIPFFLLSARSEELLKEIYQFKKKFFEEDFPRHKRWFSKNDREEFEDMLAEIKNAVDEINSSAFIIRNKYANILSWLPKNIYEDVYTLLTVVENQEDKNATIFNTIRKILETIMRELNEYGILGGIFNGTNINECSKLLSNSNLQRYVPSYIQRSIHSCTTVANDGSHTPERMEENANIKGRAHTDVRDGVCPYLVRSTILELLNILVWYHQLPKDEKTVSEIKNIAINVADRMKEDDKRKREDEERRRVVENSQEPQYDEDFDLWHCGDVMLPFKEWFGGRVILKDIVDNTHNDDEVKKLYPKFGHFDVVM